MYLMYKANRDFATITSRITRNFNFLKIRGCLVRTPFALSYLLLLTWWYGVIESRCNTPTWIGWRLNWTEQSGAVCYPPRIYVGEFPGRKIPSASPAQTHPSSAGLLLQFVKKTRVAHRLPTHPPPPNTIRACACIRTAYLQFEQRL